MIAMNTWFLPVLIIAAAIAIAWPLSRYMQIVFDDRSQSPIMRRGLQWLGWVLGESDPSTNWASYCRSMLAFNFAMFAIVYTVLSFQDYLPLNPDKKVGLEPTLAFNTAISFVTNTNLQHYSGEAALSYFSQLSLMWLQFVSAATGLAVLVAVARVMAGDKSMGDFYRDVASASLLVILPLSIVVAICLVIGGVPMTLSGAVEATTLEGARQTIARGPVAAFVAIKQLGTNGGGFYGPNSTHPGEPNLLDERRQQSLHHGYPYGLRLAVWTHDRTHSPLACSLWCHVSPICRFHRICRHLRTTVNKGFRWLADHLLKQS